MTAASSLEQVSAVTDRPCLKAFLLDELTRETVEKVSTELMIPHAMVRRGGIKEAISQLGESRSPRLLVVDISDRDLPLSDINELAEVCEPGVRVIAVGDRNDVGLFRDLMNSGVADYLVKPLTTQLLHRSLLNAVEGASPARQTSRLGRLVSVIGSRGGVGSTMIAASCGWVIANRRHRRVALLDLDLQFGTAGLGLDLETSRGLREALEQSSRIDNLYLERSMVRHSDSFHLLGGEESIEDRLELDPSGLEILTNELRAKYHFVIMDVPRHGGLTRGALESSTNVVLVTDLSVAGMRDSLRLIQFLSATNAGCGVLVVVNRMGEHKDRLLKMSDFEKGIGRPVDVVIPFQRRQLAQAIDAGEPAASRSRTVARGVDALVTELCGGSAEPRRLFRRLFS
jgi:pilus assembly protein CpaE